ncbi:MAG: CCA tRNA nucleotidyltransferase [Breznakia sp.]
MSIYQLQNPNALHLLNLLHQQHFEAYLVGGCVRDALLNRVIQDFDITTNATTDELLAFGYTHHLHFLTTGLKHGTISFFINKEVIEVTSFRSDGVYQNHRHPQSITFTNSLQCDLKRRDFSINAICYDGEHIIDHVDGLYDLKKKCIRAIGNPHQRFKEDALRILRAIRFSFTLHFKIEKNTKKAICDLHSLVAYLSKERIQSEFNKILLSDEADMILKLIDVKVLYMIIPNLKKYESVSQETPYHKYDVLHHVNACMNHSQNTSLDIKLALLLHDIEKKTYKTLDTDGIAHFHGHAHASAQEAKIILKQLKYSNTIQRKVYTLIYFHDYYLTPSLKVIRKFLKTLKGNYQLAYDILLVQRLDNMGKADTITIEKNDIIEKVESIIHQCEINKEVFCLKDLSVNGTDMKILGFKGKEIKNILEYLLTYILHQQDKNTKEHLLHIAGGRKDEIINR